MVCLEPVSSQTPHTSRFLKRPVHGCTSRPTINRFHLLSVLCYLDHRCKRQTSSSMALGTASTFLGKSISGFHQDSHCLTLGCYSFRLVRPLKQCQASLSSLSQGSIGQQLRGANSAGMSSGLHLPARRDGPSSSRTQEAGCKTRRLRFQASPEALCQRTWALVCSQHCVMHPPLKTAPHTHLESSPEP